MANVTAWGIAKLDYRGNVEAVYAPIFGAEGKADATAAPAPDVAAALEYMRARYPGVMVTYVTLHDPGTRGQHIQLLGVHPKRLIFGEYYNFDAQGRFLNVAGLSDGHLGQQAAASNYDLHFGNFAGLPVKIAYIIFGLALTAICATGTYIWLGKRQRRGIDEPRLRTTWDAVVWGVPLMLAGTFVLRKLGGNAVPLAATFWMGCIVILLAAPFVAASGRLSRLLIGGLLAMSALGAILSISLH
jgi:hypothetical protein